MLYDIYLRMHKQDNGTEWRAYKKSHIIIFKLTFGKETKAIQWSKNNLFGTDAPQLTVGLFLDNSIG